MELIECAQQRKYMKQIDTLCTHFLVPFLVVLHALAVFCCFFAVVCFVLFLGVVVVGFNDLEKKNALPYRSALQICGRPSCSGVPLRSTGVCLPL